MTSYSDYYSVFIQSVIPCWGELLGAFLMATMTNILNNRTTQSLGLKMLSVGFWAIVLRDIMGIALRLAPDLHIAVQFSTETTDAATAVLTSLATACFLCGSFKNLRLYFSPLFFVGVLTLILSGIAVLGPQYESLQWIGEHLPPIYLMLAFFMVAASFYFGSARQNKTLRIMGSGFVVLSVCYGYQVFDLLAYVQASLLTFYTLTVILSLAAQVRLMDTYMDDLQQKLDTEEQSKQEMWQILPFPIVVSRLRDDMILYMNPICCQVFGVVDAESLLETRFSDYFIESTKRMDLLNDLRQNRIVQSFEVQVKSPNQAEPIWIALTSHITTWQKEMVIFSTFQDITQQKKIITRLGKQASTDPLTGLYNRRVFEILANQSLSSARRYNTPYAVGMLDIDFFKKVNDTYGHEAGDKVLKNLADTIKKTLRQSDIVARYGGEEIVIFFVHTPPSECYVAAEHIRKAVGEMNTVVDGQSIPITVSIGISDCQNMDLDSLIKQADEGLYYSKENGRNCTTLYYRMRTDFNKEAAKQAETDDTAKGQK